MSPEKKIELVRGERRPAKSVLRLVLGLFVLVAVALIVRQTMSGRLPSSPPPSAAIQATAVLPNTVTPRTVATSPVESVQEVPEHGVESRGEPTDAGPAQPPPPMHLTPPTAKDPQVSNPEITKPTHKVVAMYFHGNIRCATCRKVEAYAKEAVEEGFAQQVRDGEVEFRPVNVEQPENRHYIQDYQLTNRSVVVVEEVGENVARWVRLDDVWSLVGNHEMYLVYVQDAVRAYVEN